MPLRTLPAPIPSGKGSLVGAVDHWSHREDDDDYYSQPLALFPMMTPGQRVLFENTARAMGDAPRGIKIRHISNSMKADQAYREDVAGAPGTPRSEVTQ